jgi:hypothetical protein
LFCQEECGLLMIIEGIVATGERRERALEGKRRNTRER